MGLLDMVAGLGGMGGMGDIEKMGKDFVDHMRNTQAGIDAVLSNQLAIMTKLGIEEQFSTRGDMLKELENAG